MPSRPTAGRSPRCSCSRRSACWPASCPAISSTRSRPVSQALAGAQLPRAGAARLADDRADRAEPQLVQRPAAVPSSLRWRPGVGAEVDPPLGFGRDAQVRAVGLRLSRREPGHAIHRGQLLAADPPRIRHRGLPGARGGSHAAAGRRQRRAHAGAAARCSVGCAVCRRPRSSSSFVAERLNKRAVPHDPRLPHPGVRRAGGAPHGACAYGNSARSARAVRPDADGAGARAAAHRLRAQGQGAPAAPAGTAAAAALPRPAAAACARRSCWRKPPPGCFASRRISSSPRPGSQRRWCRPSPPASSSATRPT